VSAISLSGIRYIYEARLQARAVLVQEGFAILGIAVGVALLFASQISGTSLARSVTQLSHQLVGGAQLQVDARGPEGFDERLLGQVRHVPGVEVALPIFERQVNVIGPSGERSVDLIGVEPNSVRASGPLLRRFSSQEITKLKVIALPAPLASEIGLRSLENVKLQIGSSFVKTFVGTTLGEGDIGGLVNSPIAVASIGYAQRLAGASARLTRIFVRVDPARSGEVRSALERLATAWNVNLVPGDFDSRLFAIAVAPESKSEELFSWISALVGFMFALNAMLVTVPSRRRLIEDVRPHGATRLMTVQILLFDAFVIAVLGCVLGLVLGDVLSIAVFHTTPGYLTFAFPVGNERIVTWQTIALAVATAMVAAVAGVLWPVRAILARPLQPAKDPADRRRAARALRPLIGILCLAFTTYTLLADTAAAIVGNIALVIALVLLLPLLFDALVSMFERASNLLDGIGTALAVTELQTPQTRVRSLAIAATAAIAVFGIVEFQGTQTNLKNGLDASAHDLDSSADVWVTPAGSSSLLTTVSFKALDVGTLARVPGVRQLGAYRGSFLDWGDRRLWVLAPSGIAAHPVPPSQFIGKGVSVASGRVRRGGWAVLSQALANENHLRVGQAFTLPSPRPVTLRLAGVTTNLGWPPGVVMLNASDYARAWLSSEPSAYQLQASAGLAAATLRERVRRALKSETGLAIETSSERSRRHDALAAQGLTRLTQIRLLVLIAAILAVVGAVAAMIWQRRDRIAFDKCHGFREAVLWRSLLCESAVLLTAGCAIGSIFGLYAQLLGSHFLATVTGFPIVFDVEGAAALSSFALVTVIAVAMLAVPGYLVVRVSPRTVSPAY
jgi:putative ABC transport system permease protein